MIKKTFLFLLIFFISFNLSAGNTLYTQAPDVLITEQAKDNDIDLNKYVIDLTGKEEFGITESNGADNLKAEINKNILTINSKDTGFKLAKFTIRNSIGDTAVMWLPVYTVELTPIVFKYKSKEKINSVSAAGEFNGWNKDADYLKDEDGDGVYKLKKFIPSGRYTYKFVIDGKKWITDDDNPLKSPDGFGGYNSLIEAGKLKRIKIYPFRRNTNRDYVKYTFFVEDTESDYDLFVLLKNQNTKEYEIIKTYDSDIDEDKERTIFTLRLKRDKQYDFVLWASSNDKLGEIRISEDENNAFDEWRDKVIYFAFTDRFYNGDKSNDNPIKDKNLSDLANYKGGDFKGITEKIKDGYFNELGIDAIWISPVCDNPETAFKDSLPPHRKFTGYHGYWPQSFEKTEEHFGSLEELKKLVDTAHRFGIKIILDMVFNHIFKDSSIYKEHPDWFGKLELADGTRNIRLFDKYPFTTWFEDFLPAFDYNKKEARDYVINNAVWWVKETGADGFRLDAVKHIPDIFWMDLRRAMTKLNPDKRFFMVGETIDSRERIKQNINYGQLDSQFDFPLYWIVRDYFSKGKFDLGRVIEESDLSDKIYGNNTPISTLIGNHDFARFTAYANGNIPVGSDEKELGFTNPPQQDKVKDEAYRKLVFAMQYLLTKNGIPMIYYGDEIGLTGAGDPDNRRMMIFKDKWNDKQKAVFDIISEWISIRKDHPALRRGVAKEIYHDKNVWVYEKYYFNDQLLIIYNGSDKENLVLPMTLSRTSWIPEIGIEDDPDISEDNFKIHMEPFSACILSEMNFNEE